MRARFVGRLPALLALALPVLAGLTYLAVQGAPQSYLITNVAALVLGLVWILLGRSPETRRGQRIAIVLMIALLFVPLLTGPSINGIARWLPLGPVIINAGAVLFPAIAVLAAQDEDYAPPMLLAAVFAAMLQPDAGLGFAIVFAAVGLHEATKDWRIGLVCIAGFFAAIVMALRGEIAPQPFVERVLIELAQTAPLLAMLLFASLIASFFLILCLAPMARRSRYALAGSLFGWSLMALLSNYPSVLIGYGAAPILGFGLALGLAKPQRD